MLNSFQLVQSNDPTGNFEWSSKREGAWCVEVDALREGAWCVEVDALLCHLECKQQTLIKLNANCMGFNFWMGFYLGGVLFWRNDVDVSAIFTAIKGQRVFFLACAENPTPTLQLFMKLPIPTAPFDPGGKEVKSSHCILCLPNPHSCCSMVAAWLLSLTLECTHRDESGG